MLTKTRHGPVLVASPSRGRPDLVQNLKSLVGEDVNVVYYVSTDEMSAYAAAGATHIVGVDTSHVEGQDKTVKLNAAIADARRQNVPVLFTDDDLREFEVIFATKPHSVLIPRFIDLVSMILRRANEMPRTSLHGIRTGDYQWWRRSLRSGMFVSGGFQLITNHEIEYQQIVLFEDLWFWAEHSERFPTVRHDDIVVHHAYSELASPFVDNRANDELVQEITDEFEMEWPGHFKLENKKYAVPHILPRSRRHVNRAGEQEVSNDEAEMKFGTLMAIIDEARAHYVDTGEIYSVSELLEKL